MNSPRVSRTIRGLCELLREQDTQSDSLDAEQTSPSSTETVSKRPKDWKRFEERIKIVYNVLLNIKGEKVVVSRDVKLKGRDGLVHQFDVYYEFSRAGVAHRVAIECRDKNRPIEKDAVMAFRSKILDVPGLQGVMVSARGYQSGAKKYAEDNGILAITMDELPGIGNLLAMTLESGLLPDSDSIGEPFWSIYEVENGMANGNLFSSIMNGWHGALLFISKRHCEDFLSLESADIGQKYAVRGITQHFLPGFISIADTHRANYWIVLDSNPNYSGLMFPISRDDLIRDYVLGVHNLPKEPDVMPRFRNKTRI